MKRPSWVRSKHYLFGIMVIVIISLLVLAGREENDMQPTPSRTVVTSLPVPPSATDPMLVSLVGQTGHFPTTGAGHNVLAKLLGDMPTDRAAIERVEARIVHDLREPARSEALQIMQELIQQGRRETAMTVPRQAQSGDIMRVVALNQANAIGRTAPGALKNGTDISDEESVQRFLLARQMLLEMSGLSEVQRQKEIATLYSGLPVTAQRKVEASLSGSQIPYQP